MAQKGTIVGIDIAKGKIDAAIRFGAEASFANSAEGRRELLAWLKQHGVCKAVMEASGGCGKNGGGVLRGGGVEGGVLGSPPGRPPLRAGGGRSQAAPGEARACGLYGGGGCATPRP